MVAAPIAALTARQRRPASRERSVRGKRKAEGFRVVESGLGSLRGSAPVLSVSDDQAVGVLHAKKRSE